jgi:hypothetical protein
MPPEEESPMQTRNTFATLACALVLLGATLTVRAQESTAPPAAAPTIEERVAAIKASIAQSKQNLKHYQWVEIEVVNLKGEDKSTTENTCYYDVNGKLVKVPAATTAEDQKKRGVRGKIVANKTEEMAEYMQGAAALIKSYLPPDPAKIQAAKDAGKNSTTPSGDGKQMRVDIKDYEKPGDKLTIELNTATNQIIGLGVASYLADTKDAVTLNVTMASLPDGTSYAATTVLDAVAKEMKITTTNSGYAKKAN